MKLAVIPARSGSKRIKNKNITKVYGKPIIYYVIKKLIKCKIFDRIIVSTDSEKISKLSNKYGAETPFRRPKYLSGDKTRASSVIKHAINYFKRKNIKIIKINKLNKKDDFLELFNKIYKKGKRRILVESGLMFINSLIKNKFIHDLYIFKSSKNLNKNGYNNGSQNLIKKIDINNKLNVNLNGDKLFRVRLNNV